MQWFDRHAGPRSRLSAYIDGQLSAADALALESHLESCDSCRRELEELSLVAVALGEMPEAELPRSFRLSPADVAPSERQAPALAAPPFLAFAHAGARLAAVTLAVALTAVVLIDRGGDSGEQARQGGASIADFGAADESAAAGAMVPEGGAGEDAAAVAPDGTELNALSESERAAEQATPPPAAATAAPLPASGGDQEVQANEQQNGDADGADEEEESVEDITELPAGDGERAALSTEDSGLETVAIVEAALAALLGLAIGATIVLTLARRWS